MYPSLVTFTKMLADRTPVNDKAHEQAKTTDESQAAAQKGLDEVRQIQAQPDKAATPSADQPGQPAAQSDLIQSSDLKAVAAAIRQATGDNNYVARWADSDKIINLVKDRSEAEKKAIDDIYRSEYKVGLADNMHAFMSGANLARFDGAWGKKDNDSNGSASDRINVALTESHQMTGRNQSIIEQDLKDSLRSKNPDQIKAIADDYQSKHGQSLKDAVNENKTLSPATKDALNTYLDKKPDSGDSDFKKLTDSALKNRDLNLFAETMSVATARQREQFRADGGDDKLAGRFSGSSLDQARDYARDGRLSAEAQIKSNTGYLWDNNQGIELGLARMTPEQRSDFAIGKSLSLDDKSGSLSAANRERLAGLSNDQQEKAREYYDRMHNSLVAAGNETEVARWESMAGSHSGGVAARLDEHRGWFYNSSTDSIKKSVQEMSEDDWKKARENPEQERADLKQMLVSLGKNADDVKAVVETFDKRIADTQYKAADGKENADAQKPEQVKEAPAETIHKAVEGFGGGQTIVDTIKKMPPEKLSELRQDYATRYGTSLDNVLIDKLNNQQMAEVQRHLISNKSIDERVDQARDEAYKTREGIGAALTDSVSATGGQADDSLRDVIAAQKESNASGDKVDRAKVQTVFENYAKAIDNNREAKAAAGEYAADAVIAGAAVAATVASGGTGLPLIAATLAAGGAATKVGARSLMMGNDYDWKVSNVSADVAGGAVTGATSVFGPGQVAAVFKLGGSAAEAASATVFTKFAEQGVLAPGAQSTLKTGTASTMHEILASGSTKIEASAFQGLAEKSVAANLTGEAREAAVSQLQKSLAEEATKQYANQTANWLANQARSQGLNTMAGMAGGTTSGAIDGVANWNSTQSLQSNLANLGLHTTLAGVSGGVGAFALGGVAKTAMLSASALRPAEAATTHIPPAITESHTVPTVENTSKPVVFRRAANDNETPASESDVKAVPQQQELTAANDNHVAVELEQKMVANGTNGTNGSNGRQTEMMSVADNPGGGGGVPPERSQKTLSFVGEQKERAQQVIRERNPNAGNLNREAEVVTGRPLQESAMATLKSDLKKQSALRDSSPQGKDPAAELKRKEELASQLAWLDHHRMDTYNFDPVAYGDLLRLKFSAESPRVDIPLDKLRTASPKAQQLAAKLLREANDGPEPSLDHIGTQWRKEALSSDSIRYKDGYISSRTPREQYGDRYEVAANKFLVKYFNSEDAATELLNAIDTSKAGKNSSGATVQVDPRDFIYIPGVKGSPADHSKIDGVFINLKKNTILPIDLKSSSGTEFHAGSDGTDHLTKRFIGASGTLETSKVKVNEKGELQGDSAYLAAGLKSVFNKDGSFVVEPSKTALAQNLGDFLNTGVGYTISPELMKLFPSMAKLANDGLTTKQVTDFASGLANSTIGALDEDRIYGRTLLRNIPGIQRGMLSERMNSEYNEALKPAVAPESTSPPVQLSQQERLAKSLNKFAEEHGIGLEQVPAAIKFRAQEKALGLPVNKDEMHKSLELAKSLNLKDLSEIDPTAQFGRASDYWVEHTPKAAEDAMERLLTGEANPAERAVVEAAILQDLQANPRPGESEASARRAGEIYDGLAAQARLANTAKQ